MKKLSVLVLLILLIISPVFSAGRGEPAEEKEKTYNWIFNVPVSEASSWYRGASRFKELVEQKTNGNISIVIVPNEQLSGGDMVRAIEMARAGSFELDIHSTIIWSNIEQTMGAISLPFAFTDYDDVDRALSGKVGEIIIDLVEQNNLHFLAFGENGFRQLTTSGKKVTSPQDMRGMKFRVPTSPVMLETFRALGSDPTAVDFAELFIALQQGMVDGQENPLGLIESSRFYEVQDYVTMWNYLYDALIFTIHKDVWDNLSPEYQQIVSDSAEAAMAWQIKINREENQALLAQLEGKGLEPVLLTDEQISEFRSATRSVWDRMRDTFGSEIMSAIEDI